jgi:hypothetical protein
VRSGADARIPDDPETGLVMHTLFPVHAEMMLQIASDYPGLPDVRELTLSQIRFWYDGARSMLKQRTKSGK